MRAGRRTEMNGELEVVIGPPLLLARMRRERGSVIVVNPLAPSDHAEERRPQCASWAWIYIASPQRLRCS